MPYPAMASHGESRSLTLSVSLKAEKELLKTQFEMLLVMTDNMKGIAHLFKQVGQTDHVWP